MTNWREEIAELVKGARGQESQASLARRSGVSNRSVGLIENSRLARLPKAETLARLAIACDQDPNDWLKRCGLTIPDQALVSLRNAVVQRHLSDRLKPADVIEQECRRYTDSQISLLRSQLVDAMNEGLAKLRSSMEERLASMERSLASLQGRIDLLVDRQNRADVRIDAIGRP